jgi:hypothetical protein
MDPIQICITVVGALICAPIICGCFEFIKQMVDGSPQLTDNVVCMVSGAAIGVCSLYGLIYLRLTTSSLSFRLLRWIIARIARRVPSNNRGQASITAYSSLRFRDSWSHRWSAVLETACFSAVF